MKLKDLEEKYELELDRIVAEIKKQKAKTVLLQFPDGLKQYASEVVDFLETKTAAGVRVWLGSCFGACDIPNSDCDLLVQFGHSPWV